MSSATQIIPGALRETNNPLLLKAEIGQPLRRGFALPHQTFTYGKTSQGKNFAAVDTFSWRPTKLKPLNLTDKKPKRDFISLNKAATQSGLVTAQEHFQYRATHDIREKNTNRINSSRQKTYLPPTTVYGMSTKVSSTGDLLEHKYSDGGWLDQTTQEDLLHRKRENERNNSFKGYSETRASRLRRYSPPVEDGPLWQMSRFQKSSPTLETFRSEDARRRAFKHHSSDCTARTGVFGHGNYEGAKS